MMAAKEGLGSGREKILYDILVPIEWPEENIVLVRLNATYDYSEPTTTA